MYIYIYIEVIFCRLKTRWNKLNSRRSGNYYGLVIDSETDPLTNLRFADDVLLFASSPADIAKMIADLDKEAGKHGLKIHMGKTVVLTNHAGNGIASVACGGQQVRVAAAADTERYLGHKLSTLKFHQTEFENRLASAWAAFFMLKDVLCNRNVPLRDRFKLFECSVTPCALYASGTWTQTAATERKLCSTRRKMIRWIVGVARHRDEEWVEYIQRATHRSEELASSHGASDWNQLQRQRKWRLAGKAATCIDGRWTRRLLPWRPWFRAFPQRCAGAPMKRWVDDIANFAGGDWAKIAQDTAAWQAAEAVFTRAAT